MAQFQFENLISDLTQFSEPIQSGRPMRWQKKACDEGTNNSQSCNTTSSGKTVATPSSKKVLKTPNKTSCLKPKTPKKTPKTPSHDRFIPNRSAMDFEQSHYAIMKGNEESTSEANDPYHMHLNSALANGNDPSNVRILHFRNRLSEGQDHNNKLKVLYSAGRSTERKSISTRNIRSQPERILDAPELLDDYYLSLIDWAYTNHLVVALGSSVYLWDGKDGSISVLMELSQPDEYVSSVKVMSDGPIVAVGSSGGYVQLWDITKQKSLRTMSGHSGRVGSLSWNTYILTSGSRSGDIYHHDVRVAEHHVATLTGHQQEVCGLAWSTDGQYLASGGNDNLLNIWDTSLGNVSTPVHSLTLHQAAVKALAWCPWQSHLLASGGGTADRHIRIWNTMSGSCVNSVDTQSQVSGILWSSEYKELVSGHGFTQNQVTIWKYPTLARVTDLMGHKHRVLCLAMSPDGTTVVSAGADETIRLWKCFEKKTVKSVKKEASSDGMLSRSLIR